MSLAESHRPHYLIICDNDSTVIKLKLKIFFWWSWFLTCIFISIDVTLMRTIGSRATTDIRNHFFPYAIYEGSIDILTLKWDFQIQPAKIFELIVKYLILKGKSQKLCHFWRLNTLLLPLELAMNRNSYIWNSFALEELPLFFNS